MTEDSRRMIEWCRKMLRIRHFEEALIGLHDQGHFEGHYHVYVGQEATAVPALDCLQAHDLLFTTHRNHGHLLARGADPARLLAEILGRRDGYNRGKGGSFHIAVAALGFLHTSAIVAGIIPLATGAAYAAKARKSGQIVVCLFGDGALEEGAAPEAFNIASIWKLPILYLCENNGKYGAGRAVGATQSPSMAAYPLTDLPAAYKVPAQQMAGTDPAAVHAVVSAAVACIRRGEGPQFIETQTVRWPGSETNWPVVPVPTSVALAWNPASAPDKQRGWYQSSDPVLGFVRSLVEGRHATVKQLAELERGEIEVIDRAVKFALASPYPDPIEATTGVFA